MSWKKIIKTDRKEKMFRERFSDEDIKDMYNESLDEMGDVKLGNLTFSPSRIIKELDPVAYRVGLNEYEDMLMEDYVYEDDDL
jgi:hypothetical protein|tara:strand:- start:20252 stop:20500 length:249 start_codon:yes stop_codon:yes gene_type:complete